MDQETIRKIAELLSQHLHYPWTFWLAQGVITIFAAAVGAFFGEYLKTRGKNLATSADFERLQGQLSAQTELVEAIKSEVSHKDWAAREWTTLRRVKLEELLNKVALCEGHHDRLQRTCLRGEIPSEDDRDFGAELRSLQTLYFPELQKETDAYILNYREMGFASLNLARAMLNAGNDLEARSKAITAYKEAHGPRYREMISGRSALDDAARN